MTRLFNALGDRLLGMFLGSVDAGACVPNHGERCCKSYGTVSCTGPCR